jgi:hypothetical protein
MENKIKVKRYYRKYKNMRRPNDTLLNAQCVIKEIRSEIIHKIPTRK